jgi:hypothetical protein
MKSNHKVLDWKKSVTKWRKRLRGDKFVVAAMQEQWENAQYDDINYDDNFYTDKFESALDALKYCLDSDCSYPPPKLLLVINDQYEEYLNAKGEISLEEAFFGGTKGRGNHAARKSKILNTLFSTFEDANKLYKTPPPQVDFISMLSNQKNLGGILDGLVIKGKEVISNPLYKITDQPDFDVDTFLRGYRRWKSARKR